MYEKLGSGFHVVCALTWFPGLFARRNSNINLVGAGWVGECRANDSKVCSCLCQQEAGGFQTTAARVSVEVATPPLILARLFRR